MMEHFSQLVDNLPHCRLMIEYSILNHISSGKERPFNPSSSIPWLLMTWLCMNQYSPAPMKQPWYGYMKHMIPTTPDDIATLKQRKTKPCSYCTGYTVSPNNSCPKSYSDHIWFVNLLAITADDSCWDGLPQGPHFTVGLSAHNSNLATTIPEPILSVIMQSAYKFAHAMIAELMWHVQNCNMIWSLFD